MGRGDVRAGDTGGGDDGVAYRRETGTDRGENLDGEEEAVGVGIGVGGHQGEDGGRDAGGRDAAEDTGVAVQGQPVGQRADNGVAEGAVATGSRRQGEGRDGGTGNVAPWRHGDGEDGYGVGVIVEAGDGEVGNISGMGIAGDGVADGDGVGGTVIVLAGTEGDGLGSRPVDGDEEERGGGEGMGRVNDGRDPDGLGGGGGQRDGVGGHAAFGDGEGGRVEDDPWPGRHAQLEAVEAVSAAQAVAGQVGALVDTGEAGIAEHDVCR